MINNALDYQVIPGPNKIGIILDASQIFIDDPGQGTPQLIRLHSREDGRLHIVYGTLECVSNECEVDGFKLNQAQIDWVNSIYNKANEWLDIWRARKIRR